MKRLIMILAIAGTAADCRSRPPEIELSSNDFDLNPLVGQWRGDYSNPAAGRSGTIAFTLLAGESSASGNVIMIPGKPDSVTAAAAMARSVLKINFVRKEGRKVAGTLDPYRDPACGCQVVTTFEGTFTDSRTIEGTFATVPSQPGPATTGGRWKVERVRRL